eukprot:g6882.t1
MKRNHVPFVDFETGYPKAANPLPQTQLTRPHVKFGGRNQSGCIVVRHRGGGAPYRLRLVDFKRGRKDIPATVLRIEYCPGRSAHVALLQYEDGVLSYILAAHAMRPGDQVIASEKANILPGNCLPLGRIPVSSIVHCVELEPGRGGQIARVAGAAAIILSRCDRYTTLKLNSTEVRKFHNECWATIGQVSSYDVRSLASYVSNVMHDHRFKGKAGVNSRLGTRNAQNPRHHPHGGGTRAKSEKKPPKNLYGKHQMGLKTRDLKAPMGLIVRRRMCNRDQRKFGMRTRAKYKFQKKTLYTQAAMKKKKTKVTV